MSRPKRPGEVSLERALSKLGIASRTQARAWIESGKVRINGIVQKNPSRWVVPETARIEIDGEHVVRQKRLVLLLHKTRGTITTRSDEHGRATVFDLLPRQYMELGGLHSVGRLDQATTGLLLLTNDSRLSSWLTDPQNAVPRVYRVSARGAITSEQSARLLRGVPSEVGLLQANAVEILKVSQRESHLLVTLHEGKNREIRRMIEAIGSEVTDLKRISYGGLVLGKLPAGECRLVSESELKKAFPEAPLSKGLE
ncbi:MAG: rRNA pseudouridine synthase [Bdellovibrionales bacterium]|nr:rRNA pseudouridine synthase [Bdellovibrionales bacterium]